MLSRLLIYCGVVISSLASADWVRAGEPPKLSELRSAASRGLELVKRAAANYPSHRECFSCHHQTLPMLAMVSAGHLDDTASAALRAQAEFTHKSFKSKQA